MKELASLKTAVIYARVSDRKQAENELSIPAQVEKGRERAKKIGASVENVFIDEGISGTTDSRPAFLSAIEYCELRNINYFIVWSSSRFARNRLDAYLYKNRLDNVGTKIIYLTMSIDRDTMEGRFFDGIMELFDEHKSIQTSVDTRRSMIKNAEQGYFNGGNPPYGYLVIPDDANPKKKKLAPCLSEAKVVKKIFELKSKDGMGARSIAFWLNENGYTNRGKKWNKTVVGALLRNQAVIGKRVYGKKDRLTNKMRPQKEWVVVDAHDPIISLTLWQEVQGMLDIDMMGSGNGSPVSTYKFTGMLECAECHQAMHIESASGRHKKYYYYNCSGAKLHKLHPPRRMSALELDEWLIDIIIQKIFTRKALLSVLKELQKSNLSWEHEKKGKKKEIVHQISELKTKVEKIFDVMETHGADIPDISMLAKRLRIHNDNLEKLEAELVELDTMVPPSLEITENDIESISSFLIRSLRAIDNVKKIRAFFSAFIEKILVYDRKVRIEYRPEVLFTLNRVKVHSQVIWLPGQAHQGITIIEADLPDKFIRAA